MITIDQLKAIVPNLPKSGYVFIKYLNEVMQQYHIDTPNRKAMFIAQLAHESMGFRRTQEIASGKAYEGRKDLGNITKGDGVKFKGRGLLQVTGRANYRELSKYFGVNFETSPQLLETPSYATYSAGWFWDKHALNKYADLPASWHSATRGYSPFEYLTYRINGALNGIDSRQLYYERALTVFSSLPAGSLQQPVS